MNGAVLVLVTSLLAVSGDGASIELGFLDGLAVGDQGVVFYQLAIQGVEKRVEIGTADITRVETESATLRLTTTRAPKSGYLVEFSVPVERHVSVRQIVEWLGENHSATLSQSLSRWIEESGSEQPDLARYLTELVAESERQTESERLAASPETATAAAEPAPTAPASEGEAKRQIRTLLFRWSRAWARSDVDAYLELYSERFVSEGGASRDDWAADRRQKLAAASQVDIQLSSVEIDFRPPDSATALFDQDYTSNAFRDSVRKILELCWEAGSWRICREDVKTR